MNLLDKASIVLTASAYNNGEALCVKPSDGSGDFDFSRNSAATRVNAQGLVEDVQILSSNLVQNGDFSQLGSEEITNGNFSQQGSQLITNGDFATDSDWTLTQATISNGSANFATTDGSFAGLRQNSVFSVGKTYLISLEVSNLVGTAEVNTNGGISIGLDITTNGTKSFYMKAESTDIDIKRKFGAEQVISATIDNVSVVEVGQDWVFSGGAVLQGESVLFAAGGNTIFQSFSGTLGKTYKISINKTGGNLRYRTGFAGADGTLKDINTTAFFTATSDTNRIQFFGDASNVSTTLNSVSIKEVGQNWSVTDQSKIEVGQAELISTDGSSQNISQLNTLVVGKNYRLQYDVLENNSGEISMTLSFGSGYGNLNSTIGTHTIDAIATNTTLQFKRRTGVTDITITNISIIEITDDTNLPRINYENFSFDGSGNIIPDSGCGNWLWENQSTNLIPYSEDFTVGNWAKTRCTVTSNQAISPDGTLNADLMTSTADDARLGDQVGSSGAEYTQSIYVKSAQVSDVNCQIDFAGLNIVNFTANQQWQRVETTLTDTSQSPRLRLRILNSGNSIYVWGAQVEEQSYSTSYIPTSGQASGVTRNQDVCNNGGSVSTINSTEGVLYAEIAALANDADIKLFEINNGGSTDRVFVFYRSGTIRAGVVVGGVTQCSFNITTNVTQFKKAALKYKENDFSFWIDGVEVATDTSGITSSVGILNNIDFSNFSGGIPFFGKTKALAVWKEALSDENLAELTTI